MTTMPGMDDFRRNLEEMRQLELTQAETLEEILRYLTEVKYEKITTVCQEIYQDEINHAQLLANLQTLF